MDVNPIVHMTINGAVIQVEIFLVYYELTYGVSQIGEVKYQL